MSYTTPRSILTSDIMSFLIADVAFAWHLWLMDDKTAYLYPGSSLTPMLYRYISKKIFYFDPYV
jgi:hypothetical protein